MYIIYSYGTNLNIFKYFFLEKPNIYLYFEITHQN